jgi:hypothetical protein
MAMHERGLTTDYTDRTDEFHIRVIRVIRGFIPPPFIEIQRLDAVMTLGAGFGDPITYQIY